MQHVKQIPGYSNFSLFTIGFLCSKSGHKCQSWKRYKKIPRTRNITTTTKIKRLKWQKEGLKRVLSLDVVKHSDALPPFLSRNLQCWRGQTFSAGVIWLVLPWSTGRVQRWPGTAHPQIFFLLTFPEYLGTFRCQTLIRWTISLFRDLLPNSRWTDSPVQLQDELLHHF